MVKHFVCQNGHQWVGHDPLANCACPQCGSAAQTQGPDHDTDDGLDARDDSLPSVPGFDVLALAGRGGMGVVFKARQIALNRIVALKLMTARLSVERLARFRAEAEAIARLAHANIVQIFDIGNASGTPFISMEFVEGGSLDQSLAGTPQPPRQAAEVTQTLARAMHHAHEQGVIHRDLKPANVLLSAAGPKITDFGLAKLLDAEDDQTRSGAVLGTPSYMAPEQTTGSASGPLCDIYSLGAILYELLTGRPPFRGPTTLATLEQVRGQEPVPPSRLQPTTPRDLETICLKCLQKEPAKRYASANDLAEDLRRYLAGEPILARAIGPLGRMSRWCRRKPALATLSAALILLTLGALAATTTLWLEADRQRRAAVEHAGNEEKERQRAEQNAINEQAQRKLAEKHLEDARKGIFRHSALMLQVLTSPAGSDPNVLKKNVSQALLLYFQDFLKTHAGDPARRSECAFVQMAVSQLAYDLGDKKLSRAALRESKAGWEAILAERPSDHRLWTQLAEIHEKLGVLDSEESKFDAACAEFETSIAFWEKLVKHQPATLSYQQSLAKTCRLLGATFTKLNRPDDAAAAFAKAEALRLR